MSIFPTDFPISGKSWQIKSNKLYWMQSKAKLPDDDDFNERFSKLKTEFEVQLKEEARLNALIAENLAKVKQVWMRYLGQKVKQMNVYFTFIK